MKNTPYTLYLFLTVLIAACSNNASLPKIINTKASFPDSVKFSPTGLKLITSFISKELGTMSTLYGNTLALQKAMKFNTVLSGGESFTLVTWKQQPDSVWFGANIPGDIQTVELLKANPNGADVVINYERYEGKEFVQNADPLLKKERIRFILDQRPSVMP